MRVSGSISWGDLSKNLATGLQKTANKVPVVIVAEADTKDAAKQSAIAYWTMGWNWDEIETVLEDSEYPKSAISYALTEAKNYAREILNSGPFSTVRSGNLVCLKNGYVGEFQKSDGDGMHVRITGAVGVTGHAPSMEVVVSADDLDMDKSNKLAAAYELEKRAINLISSVSGGAFAKSAGLAHLTEESLIDTFVNSLKVASKVTVDAINNVSRYAADTESDNYVLTAARRDADRLLGVGACVADAGKCIWALRGADSADGGTPSECVEIIRNAVQTIEDYVFKYVANLASEYSTDSPRVLNVTSSNRYDQWDETHYASLRGAVLALEELLANRDTAAQVGRVDSLHLGNRRIK